METECYPCIPMRSAFPLHSQQINPQQIRIKQEDPEDCDGEDDLEDKRPRHILKFTSPTLVSQLPGITKDGRSKMISSIQFALNIRFCHSCPCLFKETRDR